MAFAALLALAIALMVVRVWWRFGSDAFFGDWLYNGVILGCAVLAAWRGLALPGNRAVWLLIGAGARVVVRRRRLVGDPRAGRLRPDPVAGRLALLRHVRPVRDRDRAARARADGDRAAGCSRSTA